LSGDSDRSAGAPVEGVFLPPSWKGLSDLLFGRPLATDEESEQRVGAAGGIPVFGLDALGSAAYGPEAALTVLIPLGLASTAYILPISVCITALLAVVYFSYRQTIAAYPTGGGSYTVARFNLGAPAGTFAAAALMIDYLLNVAVGISTGVGALVSAYPALQPKTLIICLGLLALLTLVNLRGVRETGLLFMAPTYLFLFCMLITVIIGVVKAVNSGGQPSPVIAPPPVPAGTGELSLWLLIKAFSSGCTALTGVEAVSNGVQAFRQPVVQTAQRTLTLIIAFLMIMLLGIGYLVSVYRIGATEPGAAGYESILSQLIGAVAGKGTFYLFSIGSILAVLAFSANTSFADFPRLCRVVAQNGYLPYGFAVRGRRLVYTYGVLVLAGASAVLLIIFGGVTDRLIPLFAIGAFCSFTVSQAGMVVHWRKSDDPKARRHMMVNGLGAALTGVTAVVIMVAKFTQGAWLTLLMIPAVLLLMGYIRRHYHHVALETATPFTLDLRPSKPLVVVPIEDWNAIAKKALEFALTMSDQVQVLHIEAEGVGDSLKRQWAEWEDSGEPGAGVTRPKLVVLDSPYRIVVNPIFDYVIRLEREHPDRKIAVVISELVERNFWQRLLHNQRARTLTSLLTERGEQRIVVVNVPWYFRRGDSGRNGWFRRHNRERTGAH
jgi:amino acid transporter